ncbi:MAG: metallophosphoesterase [Oscillospiraceae bacterium]|nr:metallophosphoesterase [Oscillospiraceae bacterium]
MIKILHSADWHMDATLRAFTPEQRIALRREMLALPGKIADICIREDCDLVLLSGDLFDGFSYTPESVSAVRNALLRMEVPVFIAPGNHDYCRGGSPWMQEDWPVNVFIFDKPQITSYRLPELSCRVYGAGFDSIDCPGLLNGFQADAEERYAVMVLHGDPTAADSPYCPVTAAQVRDSGLDYLALGHIHAAGRFGAGGGLCAWPGCPMGKGYDETGIKGVLVVELERDRETVLQFVPVDGTRFYDWNTEAGENPVRALERALPAEGSEDFYRIHLTGESQGIDLEALRKHFSRFPNLTLLDETVPVTPLWERAGEDSLEGVCFRLLQDAMATANREQREELELAARLCRSILQGQEVTLP